MKKELNKAEKDKVKVVLADRIVDLSRKRKRQKNGETAKKTEEELLDLTRIYKKISLKFE